jgi:hypothetical protein
MIYKIKQLIAKKMMPSPDREDEGFYHGGAQGAFVRKGKKLYRMSTSRGKQDKSTEAGHGMFEDQGLTNYIKRHENDTFDTRRGSNK